MRAAPPREVHILLVGVLLVCMIPPAVAAIYYASSFVRASHPACADSGGPVSQTAFAGRVAASLPHKIQDRVP